MVHNPFLPSKTLWFSWREFSSEHSYHHVEAHTIYGSAGDLAASIVTETYMESWTLSYIDIQKFFDRQTWIQVLICLVTVAQCGKTYAKRLETRFEQFSHWNYISKATFDFYILEWSLMYCQNKMISTHNMNSDFYQRKCEVVGVRKWPELPKYTL